MPGILHHELSADFRRRGQLIIIVCQVLACAPSDFDELTAQARDPVECEEPECLDADALVIDAGQEEEERDAISEPISEELDAATTDADLARPDGATRSDAAGPPGADAAPHDARDAALDGAKPALDSGSPSQACDGSPSACRASEVERQMEACGSCNRGLRTRTRTCAADGCSWGAWGAWSACAMPSLECEPSSAAQTQTVACTTCGTRTQTRSCSRDTCTWGAWTDASACTWCEECSEVVYCDTPSNIADRGTWCRQKACSREQALSDCQEDVKSACGTTIQPFYMQYL